jgi:hypothetical protein
MFITSCTPRDSQMSVSLRKMNGLLIVLGNIFNIGRKSKVSVDVKKETQHFPHALSIACPHATMIFKISKSQLNGLTIIILCKGLWTFHHGALEIVLERVPIQPFQTFLCMSYIPSSLETP